uniref:RNA polymerase II-associated factor 1 homolog n=1 Tax=Glossina austeni TaxID=7395 RepID=A0A1A9VGW9_GLOAU
MLLSIHLFVHYRGAQQLLEERINMVEEIGLDLKAVVCDRAPANRKTLRGFRNGVYLERRKEGRPYKMRQIYDYIHLINSHYQKMLKKKRCDVKLVDKLRQQYLKDENKAACNLWLSGGVLPSVAVPRTFPENIAFFDNVTPVYLKAALNAKRIRGPTARRTYEYIAAITKLANVFHRNELNVENWEENKETLNSLKRFLTTEHKMVQLALETKMAIHNSIKLIEELLQTLPDISIKGYRAEEAFQPFGLDDEPYEDIEAQQTPQHTQYFWRLGGYAVGQVIGDEIRCRQCLNDLTITRQEACKTVGARTVTIDEDDNDILPNKYLKADFLKADVKSTSKIVFELIYQITNQHMPDANLGLIQLLRIKGNKGLLVTKLYIFNHKIHLQITDEKKIMETSRMDTYFGYFPLKYFLTLYLYIMIRRVMDECGEQFVAYLLPTEVTLEKRRSDFAEQMLYKDDEVCEYKIAREYNWNVKSKASKGYEGNYFFVIRPDDVFYNELETRVRLNKRRMKARQQPSNKKLVVKHRPLDANEHRMQRYRERRLEPAGDEDEEEEEMAVDRDGVEEEQPKELQEDDNDKPKPSDVDEKSRDRKSRSRCKSHGKSQFRSRSRSGSRSGSASGDSRASSRSRSHSKSGSRSHSPSRSRSRSKSVSRSRSRSPSKSRSPSASPASNAGASEKSDLRSPTASNFDILSYWIGVKNFLVQHRP